MRRKTSNENQKTLLLEDKNEKESNDEFLTRISKRCRSESPSLVPSTSQALDLDIRKMTNISVKQEHDSESFLCTSIIGKDTASVKESPSNVLLNANALSIPNSASGTLDPVNTLPVTSPSITSNSVLLCQPDSPNRSYSSTSFISSPLLAASGSSSSFTNSSNTINLTQVGLEDVAFDSSSLGGKQRTHANARERDRTHRLVNKRYIFQQQFKLHLIFLTIFRVKKIETD